MLLRSATPLPWMPNRKSMPLQRKLKQPERRLKSAKLGRITPSRKPLIMLLTNAMLRRMPQSDMPLREP